MFASEFHNKTSATNNKHQYDKGLSFPAVPFFLHINSHEQSSQLKAAQTEVPSCPLQRLALPDNVQSDISEMDNKPAGIPKSNNTGLPSQLKAGIESLSGISMEDVKVNYNSDQPKLVNALAFAQGSQIHLGPGQEKHLPHEAWHVVQQKQGRVAPTMQMKSKININDDLSLEKEADLMGGKASGLQPGLPLQMKSKFVPGFVFDKKTQNCSSLSYSTVVQRQLTTYDDIEQVAKKGKFKWSDYRTVMNNKNSKKRAKSYGLGVIDSKGGKEFTTKIKWDPVHEHAKEGTKIEANLGPDHTLGSEPQKGATNHWNKRTSLLSKISGKRYIAGHLLNHNLGGPGDDGRNLTAIPSNLNAIQSANIEEVFKKAINEEHRFIHYRVEVTYETDDSILAKSKNNQDPVHYASKISTKWYALNADKTKDGDEDSMDINIPKPSLNQGLNKQAKLIPAKIKGGVGHKASVDPTKEIVLNNSSYLGIATKATSVVRKKIEKIRGKYSDALTQLTILGSEDVNNKDKIKELKEQLKILTEQNNELDQQNITLQSELSEMISSNKELQGQNEILKSELDEIAQQNEELREQNEDLKLENTEITRRKKTLEEENESLNKDNILLEQLLSIEKSASEELRLEVENYSRQIKLLNEKIDELNKDIDKVISERRKSSAGHSEKLEKAVKKYKDKNTELEQMLFEIKKDFKIKLPDEINESDVITKEASPMEGKESSEKVETDKSIDNEIEFEDQLTPEEKDHLQFIKKSDSLKDYKSHYIRSELVALYDKLNIGEESSADLNMRKMWLRIRKSF